MFTIEVVVVCDDGSFKTVTRSAETVEVAERVSMLDGVAYVDVRNDAGAPVQTYIMGIAQH